MDHQAQIAVLYEQIASIKAEGPIAPVNTWIDEFRAGSKRVDGYKYYTYYKLMEATEKKSKTGKIQGRQIAYLGKVGSRKYEEARASIHRRNEIQRLEREIERLQDFRE